MDSLFKISVNNGEKNSLFMNLLFIDRWRLQCCSRGTTARDEYEAERGSEEALLCPQSHARCSEGASSV